jgi:hypothetical protein
MVLAAAGPERGLARLAARPASVRLERGAWRRVFDRPVLERTQARR